jgi:imidazolonepropionase-like amidohydrolase
LSDADAARAAAAGVDGLAHTPVAPLSEATVAAWSGGFVISTLGAFGGSAATIDNLRRLRGAGAAVLYGTDFGNTTVAGIDARELTLLGQAGLDGRAIADALGPTPAQIWGLADAGAIRVGAPASFLLLAADPSVDPSVWARPDAVWFAGEAR